jgi:hypothetical protein
LADTVGHQGLDTVRHMVEGRLPPDTATIVTSLQAVSTKHAPLLRLSSAQSQRI